ncbi:MAG TPA: PA2169 family four-helix-bundle protein [Rudaea sp.]
MESHTDTATLKELVEVLDDGKKFYLEASEKVDRTDLRQLFSRMARTKGAIAGDLKTRIVATGKSAPNDGSLSGSLRKTWGEVRARLSSAPNAEYVDQLEGFEDRIVHAFRDAAEKSDDAEVRAVAAKYMPEVLRDHGEMSALKHQLKH